ncbi:hypothetical protein HCH_01202 [Hahella chejuensis KCTC 2396]|uniref:Uncharacterized protein n=1 Tax=Hahella chejuensis (strain KCTC 2396) TaxID=349521 RepID=Q2SMP9_HAHCH|nr:hypothetical protein HCH_01202 [Hahella chejuensis KCTC 2396]
MVRRPHHKRLLLRPIPVLNHGKGDAITIWDLESGALLYEYPCDLPVNYLPGSREFVCNEGNGVLALYGWRL